MNDERVLLEAEFNPKVCTYWLLSGGLILAVSVVGLPLAPLWFIVGTALTRRYLDRMACILTDRSLKVSKGWLVRVEKTVPLDKITDLGMVQGPIMRWLDIEALSIETAGQSSQGALVRMTGIRNARGFRDAVLRQRDAVATRLGAPAEGEAPGAPRAASGLDGAVLTDIRDTLHRIEGTRGERGGG